MPNLGLLPGHTDKAHKDGADIKKNVNMRSDPSRRANFILLADIDAVKHQSSHPDYKYRDDNAILLSLSLLIQHYSLQETGRDNVVKKVEPHILKSKLELCLRRDKHGRHYKNPSKAMWIHGSSAVEEIYLGKLRTGYDIYTEYSGLPEFGSFSSLCLLQQVIEAAKDLAPRRLSLETDMKPTEKSSLASLPDLPVTPGQGITQPSSVPHQSSILTDQDELDLSLTTADHASTSTSYRHQDDPGHASLDSLQAQDNGECTPSSAEQTAPSASGTRKLASAELDNLRQTSIDSQPSNHNIRDRYGSDLRNRNSTSGSDEQLSASFELFTNPDALIQDSAGHRHDARVNAVVGSLLSLPIDAPVPFETKHVNDAFGKSRLFGQHLPTSLILPSDQVQHGSPGPEASSGQNSAIGLISAPYDHTPSAEITSGSPNSVGDQEKDTVTDDHSETTSGYHTAGLLSLSSDRSLKRKSSTSALSPRSHFTSTVQEQPQKRNKTGRSTSSATHQDEPCPDLLLLSNKTDGISPIDELQSNEVNPSVQAETLSQHTERASTSASFSSGYNIELNTLKASTNSLSRRISDAVTNLFTAIALPDPHRQNSPFASAGDPYDLRALFNKCWGAEWHSVCPKLRDLQKTSSQHCMRALVSGFLHDRVLADGYSWQVEMGEKIGVYGIEGTMVFDHLSQDPERMRSACKAWTRLIAHTIATDSAGSQLIKELAVKLSIELIEVLHSHVSRLLGIAKALYSGPDPYDETSRLSNFQDDLSRLMDAALQLKLDLTRCDSDHDFIWPFAGELLDPSSMQPMNLPGPDQQHQVAYTLFPSIQIRGRLGIRKVRHAEVISRRVEAGSRHQDGPALAME